MYRQIHPERMDKINFFYSKEENLISLQDVKHYYENLQQAIPQYSYAYSLLAAFLLDYGKWSEAEEKALKALEFNKDDFIALRTLMIIHFTRESDQEAYYIERFGKVVSDKPEFNYMLSRFAENMGRSEDAIYYAEKSLAKIRSFKYMKHLADLYEEQGNFEKAKYYKSQLLRMSLYGGKQLYDYASEEIERLSERMKEAVGEKE